VCCSVSTAVSQDNIVSLLACDVKAFFLLRCIFMNAAPTAVTKDKLAA